LKLKRIIVALFIVPILVAWIYFLPPFPYFLALLVGVGMLAMREFYVMYGVSQKLSVDAIFLVFFLILFLRIVVIKTPSGSMSDIGPLGVGLLYICGFLSFQWLLRTEDYGMEYLLLLYASVWIADSMAYYIGTYMGRNKLYPAMSPNKTIEGALGSIIGGAISALSATLILDIPGLTVSNSLFIGAILGTATVIGDLIESMFKRDAGVKDSSNLIPGHGGILDKIDGLLVAGPVLYFVMRYFT
jgi:phosphatidate cytidylyltransferase